MIYFKKNITRAEAPVPDSGKRKLLHRRSLRWMVALAVTLAADRFVPPAFWEACYYQGVFRAIRVTYDYLLGWSPVPMVYMVLAVILARTIQWAGEWKKGFLYQVSRITGGISAMVVLFYVLWGFNYHQVPLPKRLGYDLTKSTAEAVAGEFAQASDDLRQEAERLPMELTSVKAIRFEKINENALRQEVRAVLRELSLPSQGKVRVRQLWPKGTLLRWNTAGIYMPPTCEGHIDMGLLSIQKPFTMAHEMAHGFGVTDEGDCNFIAWLACRRAADPWTRFSGAYVYWRYAAAEMKWEAVKPMIETFPPVVKTVLDEINQNDRRYPDLLPRFRDQVYSSYLHHHGVAGGLRSYNRVVLMVELFRKQGIGTGKPE